MKSERVREIEDFTYILHTAYGYTFLQRIHVRWRWEQQPGTGTGRAEHSCTQARATANWKVLVFAGSGFSTRDSGLEGENKIHTIKFIRTEVEIAQEVTTTNNHADTTYQQDKTFMPMPTWLTSWVFMVKQAAKQRQQSQQKYIASQDDASA